MNCFEKLLLNLIISYLNTKQFDDIRCYENYTKSKPWDLMYFLNFTCFDTFTTRKEYFSSLQTTHMLKTYYTEKSTGLGDHRFGVSS